jgi:hypothetical protein
MVKGSARAPGGDAAHCENLNSNSVSKVFSSVGHQDYLSSNPVEWHAYVTDFLRAVQRLILIRIRFVAYYGRG